MMHFGVTACQIKNYDTGLIDHHIRVTDLRTGRMYLTEEFYPNERAALNGVSVIRAELERREELRLRGSDPVCQLGLLVPVKS